LRSLDGVSFETMTRSDDEERLDRFADTPIPGAARRSTRRIVPGAASMPMPWPRRSRRRDHRCGRDSAVHVRSRPVSYAANPKTTQEAGMAGYFELYQDKAKQYRFRLKAGNHEVVATSSESYPDKATAKKGIDAVKNAANGATVKEV
jgi:uncharacterized protein